MAAAKSVKSSASSHAVGRRVVRPRKSGEISATKKMLDHTRAELKSNITTLRLETRAGFARQGARFKRIEARFKDIDARFDRIEAILETVVAQNNRMLALFEEQEARNKFVLDGYASLDHRLSLVEAKVKDI